MGLKDEGKRLAKGGGGGGQLEAGDIWRRRHMGREFGEEHQGYDQGGRCGSVTPDN